MVFHPRPAQPDVSNSNQGTKKLPLIFICFLPFRDYALFRSDKRRSIPISDLKTAESSTILEVVLTSLDDDKAQDVISIPLAGKSTIADYMVIASGASSRQLTSMADHLGRKLKECGFMAVGAEGGSAATGS